MAKAKGLEIDMELSRCEKPTAPPLTETVMASGMGDKLPMYGQGSGSDRPLMGDHPSPSNPPSLSTQPSTQPSTTDQDHHECSCSCSCFYRRQVGQRRSLCSKRMCVITLVVSIMVNCLLGGAICYYHLFHHRLTEPEVPRAPVHSKLLCLGQPREKTLPRFPEAPESDFRSNTTCVTSDWMHDLAAETILSKSCDHTGKELTAPFGSDIPSALLYLDTRQFLGARLPWRPYFSSMKLFNNSLIVNTAGRYFIVSVVAHPSHAGAYRSHSVVRQRSNGSSQEVLMTKTFQGFGGDGGSWGSGKDDTVSILVGVLYLDTGDSVYVPVDDGSSVCRNSYTTFLGVWKV